MGRGKSVCGSRQDSLGTDIPARAGRGMPGWGEGSPITELPQVRAL